MRNFFTQRILALVLIFTFVVPASLLVAPKPAHAILGAGDTVIVTGDFSWSSILRTIKSAGTYIKTGMVAANSFLSSAAEYALMLNKYVLTPLVFAESGNLLKSVTAGILKFITGGNKKGTVMFVTSLKNFKQGTQDNHTLRFANSFGNKSNSPFADSIRTSLLSRYSMNSSIEGFLASNKCSLSKKKVGSFVGGNFGKGGWNTWFSLTTVCKNNPYCLTYNAQSHMSDEVANATQSVLSKLSWGNGFLSWCSADVDAVKNDSASRLQKAGQSKTKQTSIAGNYKYNSKVGNSAGDPCLKKDGTPGTIKTPGSVIKDSLKKILGTNVDKWALTGEVNKMLGSAATIMQTVQLSKTVIAGANGSGGLLGLGHPSSNGGRSWADQYADSKGYFGQTTQNILQASAANTSVSTTTLQARIVKYGSSWNKVFGSANTASTTLNKLASLYFSTSTSNGQTTNIFSYYGSTNLTQLVNTCNADKASAKTALKNRVNPVLAKKQTVAEIIAGAEALIQKINKESNGTTQADANAYTQDLLSAQKMRPTTEDVGNVQQDASVLNGAVASPDGSLNVSTARGTVVDQLNLLNTNATNIITKCAPVATTTPTQNL